MMTTSVSRASRRVRCAASGMPAKPTCRWGLPATTSTENGYCPSSIRPRQITSISSNPERQLIRDSSVASRLTRMGERGAFMGIFLAGMNRSEPVCRFRRQSGSGRLTLSLNKRRTEQTSISAKRQHPITTMETSSLNMEALNSLVHKLVGDLGAAVNGALVVLGDRLGIYQALANSGPVTSEALAEEMGLDE